MLRSGIGIAFCLAVVAFAVGCATSSESAQEDTLTANVGNYGPPPAGLKLKRAAVPPFLDASGKERSRSASENLGALAADQLTTLLVNSQRFDVIERAQLDQLLKEQGLEGIVDPNELAQPNKVHGVDYLLIGKVTNYRVKVAKTKTGFGIGRVTEAIGVGEIKNDKTEITVDCGVDLRVVDPTTGSLIAADFAEYKKTDTLKSMGVDVLGVNATAEGDLQLSEDNQGKILRLALDQCMRKMMPKLDRALLARQK
jgi:curli biogenesis system outer membrane secretion channel CsgG